MSVSSARRLGSDPAGLRRPAATTLLLWIVVVVFAAIALPVIVRGAPLADDFTNCVQPERIGLPSTLAASIDRLGASRKAHLLEILVTSQTCRSLPFGVAIAVPAFLTVVVALLLRGLLRDVGVPPAWSDVAAAAWLLQPLGTESALWPAAMHIPLGLAFGLAGLRLHRRGRHGWASIAVVGAGLSLEQALLALPVAVWMTCTDDRRRLATAMTGALVAGLLVTYLLWPGNDPRLQVTPVDRIQGALGDPLFPLRFAGVGLGLHSIPLAAVWAFPYSVVLLAAGAVIGWRLGPTMSGEDAGAADGRAAPLWAVLLSLAGLVVALNVPIVFNVPHQASPRLFAPTWLVVASAVGVLGARIPASRLPAFGAVTAVFGAGALLSLTLSVSVRLASADFTEHAEGRVAAAVRDGAVVGVCGVDRTVVEPAPRGAFALHEFVYAWAARDALAYYTGRSATFRLSGALWDRPCPSDAVDRVFRFPSLVDDWRARV